MDSRTKKNILDVVSLHGGIATEKKEETKVNEMGKPGWTLKFVLFPLFLLKERVKNGS